MAIAMSPTREKFPLSKKKVVKKTIGGTLGWIFVLLIVGGIIAGVFVGGGENTAGYVPLIIGVALAVLGVMVILTYLYQLWYFNVYYYDLGQDFITIRKGPITPHEITIPYERIQDVYVDQDLLDRMMGLYDVHLSSATISSGMAAHIDGVEKSAADGMRAMLLETVSRKIGKNKSQPTP